MGIKEVIIGLKFFNRYTKWYTKKKRGSVNFLIFSDLDRIQTCNLLSRNQVHYSVMLRGHCKSTNISIFYLSQNEIHSLFVGKIKEI